MDVSHTYGSDLMVSATGDIALSDGAVMGQQRVLRRLLTAPRAYIWHLAYGAGLPRFVGQVADKQRIAAVAKAQMYRESAVSRNPAPAVNVTVNPTGVVTLGITYADTGTAQPAVLNFNLNG